MEMKWKTHWIPKIIQATLMLTLSLTEVVEVDEVKEDDDEGVLLEDSLKHVRVHLLVESQSPRQFENHIPSLFLLDPSLLVG
ncbi:hypothetical protein Q3G72_006724 [Acer saccharum]|nr:hypothetical protein Q3G72_006724 [Acer saccharum]